VYVRRFVCILLYPELECKMSGTSVLTERLVTEGRWLRVVRTRKNWYSRIQLQLLV